MVVGVTKEPDGEKEILIVRVEDCEAPLVVEDTVLRSAVLETTDSEEEGLGDEGEEPEDDPDERDKEPEDDPDEGEAPETDPDAEEDNPEDAIAPLPEPPAEVDNPEGAILAPLPEPLAEVETLPVDDVPAFRSDQTSFASWLDEILTGEGHRRG